MTRPPRHGTTGYARGNTKVPQDHPLYRPPCHCQRCTAAMRAYKKAWRLANHRGTSGRVSAEPSRARLLALREAGLGWPQLVDRTQCSFDTIRGILNGDRQEILRRTEAKILAVEPRTESPARGLYVDATGTRRRVRALQAIGHSTPAIAAEAEVSVRCIEVIAAGARGQVRQWIADAVVRAYGELSMRVGTSKKSRTLAARKRWAGPLHWDEEAIDDPTGAPEWTGCCGTISGWHKHHIEGLPMCDRCEAAHEEWELSVAGLTPAERNSQRMRERNAVMGRRAALAENWAELQRQGYTLDTAAERLGVNKSTLAKAVDWFSAFGEAA